MQTLVEGQGNQVELEHGLGYSTDGAGGGVPVASWNAEDAHRHPRGGQWHVFEGAVPGNPTCRRYLAYAQWGTRVPWCAYVFCACASICGCTWICTGTLETAHLGTSTAHTETFITCRGSCRKVLPSDNSIHERALFVCLFVCLFACLFVCTK